MKIQGKLYKQLLLNFIIFLTVPLVIYILFFQISISGYFKNMIHETNKHQLLLLQNDFETTLESVKRNALLLVLDQNVKELYELQNEGNTTSPEYLKSEIKVLSDLQNTMDMRDDIIHTIYLYNRKTGHLMTSDKANTSIQNFYDTSWQTTYEANNAYSIMPERKPYNQNQELPYVIDDRAQYDVITMIYPITTYSSEGKDGAIIINIYKDYIDTLQTVYEENYLITDGKGKIISSITEEPLMEALTASEAYKEVFNVDYNLGYLEVKLMGEDYLLLYQKSLTTNYTYLKLAPINTLYDLLNRTKLTFLTITVSILLLGIFLSITRTRNLYTPIDRIMHVLEDKKVPMKGNFNELSYIHKAVDHLIKEDTRITELLKDNQETLEKNHILELIRGNGETNVELLIEGQWHYCCLLLSIDQYKEFAERYSYKDQYTFKNVLLRLCEEELNQISKGVGVLLENDKIAIVAFLPIQDKNKNHQLIQKICQRVLNKTNQEDSSFSISVTYGDMYKDIYDIRPSFKEALQALTYRMSSGFGSIIPYATIPTQDDDRLIPLPDFIASINNMNKESMESEITGYFRQLKDLGFINSTNVMDYLYPLISSLMNYLYRNHLTLTQIAYEHPSMYHAILEKDTLWQIQKEVLDICTLILDYKEKLVSENNYIQKVLRCIEARYTEANLDINAIADEVGISYSYVRKLIKDETGHSLNTYLNQLRIAMAKELLINSDEKIKEIAIMVGYNTDQSFSRYFKKFEKMTPSEYRKSNITDRA